MRWWTLGTVTIVVTIVLAWQLFQPDVVVVTATEPVATAPLVTAVVTTVVKTSVTPAFIETASEVLLPTREPNVEPAESQLSVNTAVTPLTTNNPATQPKLSNAQNMNALLAQSVAVENTGSDYRGYWRQVWPLSRQRDAFDEAITTIDLIEKGLIKHGWHNGSAYLSLAGEMNDVAVFGPILNSYWQRNDNIDEQNWRAIIATLQTVQAGDKVAFLAESQALCNDLIRLSELAVAYCFGSLLDRNSFALALNNLEEAESIIALVRQSLAQGKNLTPALLNQVTQIALTEPEQTRLNVAIVDALANVDLEYLRQPTVAPLLQSALAQTNYNLSGMPAEQQDEVLDSTSLKLHEYHRLYLLAATTPDAGITDNWLDRAGEQEGGVELMLFGRDMILSAYQNPEQNKLIDDLNRYALKLYQRPEILAAMRQSIEYCRTHQQADLIGLQLLDLVTFQSPGRDSEFNQLYRELVGCNQYPR